MFHSRFIKIDLNGLKTARNLDVFLEGDFLNGAFEFKRMGLLNGYELVLTGLEWGFNGGVNSIFHATIMFISTSNMLV